MLALKFVLKATQIPTPRWLVAEPEKVYLYLYCTVLWLLCTGDTLSIWYLQTCTFEDHDKCYIQCLLFATCCLLIAIRYLLSFLLLAICLFLFEACYYLQQNCFLSLMFYVLYLCDNVVIDYDNMNINIYFIAARAPNKILIILKISKTFFFGAIYLIIGTIIFTFWLLRFLLPSKACWVRI